MRGTERANPWKGQVSLTRPMLPKPIQAIRSEDMMEDSTRSRHCRLGKRGIDERNGKTGSWRWRGRQSSERVTGGSGSPCPNSFYSPYILLSCIVHQDVGERILPSAMGIRPQSRHLGVEAMTVL